MPSQPAVLDEARDLVKRRLTELDEERMRLERAVRELDGGVGRRPGRQRGSKSSKPTKRPRNRNGFDQVVSLIGKESEGITAKEIVKRTKIGATYVYRVLGELQREGRARKRGSLYLPVN